MEASELLRCSAADCERDAIVFLSGRPLCYQHYVSNLNELHELGLTPRGLTEDAKNMNGTHPLERRVRTSVDPPERKRAPENRE